MDSILDDFHFDELKEVKKHYNFGTHGIDK